MIKEMKCYGKLTADHVKYLMSEDTLRQMASLGLEERAAQFNARYDNVRITWN